LEAAKERARRERKTAGQVVSELLRAALTAPATPRGVVREAPGVYGIRPFSAGAVVVTNAKVDALRQQDAY
jgi:hypothetical protein